MIDARLALRQARFTNKAFWRNPASAFFTFAFPLLFLVIFTSFLGNGTALFVLPSGARFRLEQSTYFVAAMAAFSVITACYTNIAMGVTYQRDVGILKRTRGTPLPGWAYMTGRVLQALGVGFLLVVITAAFGIAFYGAHVPTGIDLVRFLVVLVVGAMSFAALGLATTAAVPNADAAPAVVNGIILPLLFVSGIFFPIDATAPQWIRVLGGIFPVKHFADAMLAGFYGAPLPFHWRDVLILGAWGVAGLMLAVRFFSWEPRK
ncbi:MAG TPA: ABC transporter permease [Actinomycetota bacterium]|nr:ABC transporter permease [Actinomycetota bacterium]